MSPSTFSDPVKTRVLYADAAGVVVLGDTYVLWQLREEHEVLSFAPYRGGSQIARSLAIHQVKNHDLPLGFEPLELLGERMRQLDTAGIGMLTSRNVDSVEFCRSAWPDDNLEAVAVVTAGLSNAIRVGDTPGELAEWGTINILCRLSRALGTNAMLEALSIVTEARTAAVLAAQVGSRRSRLMASGTGTDCIAVLAPRADTESLALRYAGKHTAAGHVIGDAVTRALSRALDRWKREPGR